MVFDVTIAPPVPRRCSSHSRLSCSLCESVWNRFHISENTMRQMRDDCQEEKFVTSLGSSLRRKGGRDSEFLTWLLDGQAGILSGPEVGFGEVEPRGINNFEDFPQA